MKLPVRILIPAVLLILALLSLFLFKNGEFIPSGHENDRMTPDTGENPQIQTADIEHNLRKIVDMLSREIGSRSYLQIDALQRSADYIASELKGYGYRVSFQPYEFQAKRYSNISVEIEGGRSAREILVIGAHYDTVTGTPGADDNASGIAGLLETARLLRTFSPERTVRFVAFSLEEPPLFRTKSMGSYVYARSLKQKGESVVGMICLEMIGFFADSPGSQLYPLPFFRWFYPERGDFIAFVSNIRSRTFLNRAREAFQEGTALPVESISTVSVVPGVDFSDHRSFWQFGYDALMVTDTAFFRNPHYHGSGDTADTLDYRRMAQVVLGLKAAIEHLAGTGEK